VFKLLAIIPVSLACCLPGGVAASEPPHLIRIHPDPRQWKSSTRGPYDVVLDIRDIYQINAHWEVSRAGNYGQLSTTVTIPETWVLPIKLRLFIADDYIGWNIDRSRGPSWFVETTFVGHRFKQVLIDGRLLWEQDVADTGTGQYYDIDLGWGVSPGQTIEITLRMIDKVASDVELPGDYHRIGDASGRQPCWSEPSTYLRFETRSYWADVVLYDNTVSRAELERATGYDWLAGAHYQGGWHQGAEGIAVGRPLRLRLETNGAPLPSTGYPVRSGVPFARGMLPAGQPVELRDPQGGRLPVQTTVLGKWPDGSARWLLVDFIAPPDSAEGKYTLIWKNARPFAPRHPVVARKGASGTDVTSGAISFRVPAGSGPRLLENIRLADNRQPVISSLSGIVECFPANAEGASAAVERFQAVRENCTVESAGPIRATLRVDGKLVADSGETLGAMVMRVDAWANLPYLRITYRIFNNSDAHRKLRLSRLRLLAPGDGTLFEGLPTVSCDYADAAHPGPDGILAADGFGLAVRYFWQQFPQAIVPADNTLCLDLYHPVADDHDQSWFAVGEAKRHEIMLSFAADEKDNQRALEVFQLLPRLFDKRWFCQSGGWGPASWHNALQFPEVHEALAADSRTLREDTWGGYYGRRDFGDGRYGNGWYNNYYDMAHTLFAEYMMGGDRAFYRRAETLVLHLMDVDVEHYNAADTGPGQKPGAVWDAYPSLPRPPTLAPHTGAVHMFSSRHHNLTRAYDYKGFSPRGYWDYYHLTGDLDALQTALLVGEYVRRSGAGMGGRSARAQAFPLICLMAMYQETGRREFLDAAGRLVDDAMVNMVPRRGGYVEPFLSFEYVANAGGMLAHLTEGMMMYWAATGDRRVAEAIVSAAASIYAENMGGPAALPCYWKRTSTGLKLLPAGQGERGQLGVTHYSGNPFQKNWAPEYFYQVCQAFLYAYDLTGKTEFLDAARNGYLQAARGHLLGALYAYSQAPVVLYYLQHFSRVAD